MPASDNDPNPPLIPRDIDFHTSLVEVTPGNEDTDTLPFLSQYDAAMKRWIEAITVWDGRVVPVVFAAPLRAFSQYRQLLIDNQISPLVPPRDADINWSKPPLPLISYTRGDFHPGPRQNQNYPIRNLAFLNEAGKRRTAWTRYPLSMIIPYQVEIWTKSFQTQTVLVEAMLTQFWPKIAYWTVQGSIVPNLLMPIKLLGISDTSTLEGGQDGERLLRITFNLEVEAQKFFTIFKAPTFLREDLTVGAADQDGSNFVADLTISTDQSEGYAPPSLAEIQALPRSPQ